MDGLKRTRLQLDIDEVTLERIRAATAAVRARCRVDFVRRAIDVYLELVTVLEQDGEIKITRKDGVIERIRL